MIYSYLFSLSLFGLLFAEKKLYHFVGFPSMDEKLKSPEDMCVILAHASAYFLDFYCKRGSQLEAFLGRDQWHRGKVR